MQPFRGWPSDSVHNLAGKIRLAGTRTVLQTMIALSNHISQQALRDFCFPSPAELI
jgi:hypothetical protein